MWGALLLGSLSGIVGTGLGGTIGYLLKKPSGRVIASLMNFSGGLMIAVVCFDLLPEAFMEGGLFPSLVGVVLGLLLMVGLERIVPADDPLVRTGMMLALGIALHNLPEGMAIGAGYAQAPLLGFGLCAVIACHDVPEGVALAVPLRAGGASALRVVIYAVLSGVPTALGAVIGYGIGQVSPALMAGNLGLAAGAMLYVVSGELLPQSYDFDKGRFSLFMMTLGIIAGSIITFFI